MFFATPGFQLSGQDTNLRLAGYEFIAWSARLRAMNGSQLNPGYQRIGGINPAAEKRRKQFAIWMICK